MDITAQILNLAKEYPINREGIVFGAYLSNRQLNDYLALMTGEGLVDYSVESATFRTVEKRRRLTERSKQLKTLASLQRKTNM